jgi:hypothetical protein
MVARYVLPHFLGFVCIVAGWYVSIINVGLFKYNEGRALHTKETLAGLVLILIGAYIPNVWQFLWNLFSRKQD